MIRCTPGVNFISVDKVWKLSTKQVQFIINASNRIRDGLFLAGQNISEVSFEYGEDRFAYRSQVIEILKTRKKDLGEKNTSII